MPDDPYGLDQFTRDAVRHRDAHRKATRWPAGADKQLRAEQDYREAARKCGQQLIDDALATSRKAHGKTKRDLDQAYTDLARTDDQLTAAKREAAAQRDRCAGLLTELGDAQAERDMLAGQLAQAKHELAEMQGALAVGRDAPPVPHRDPPAPAEVAVERARSAAKPRTARPAGTGRAGSSARRTAPRGGAA